MICCMLLLDVALSLDLASGYHQIPLTREKIPRSTAVWRLFQNQLAVMAVGLTNASAIF
jgi:hypothetical protein